MFKNAQTPENFRLYILSMSRLKMIVDLTFSSSNNLCRERVKIWDTFILIYLIQYLKHWYQCFFLHLFVEKSSEQLSHAQRFDIEPEKQVTYVMIRERVTILTYAYNACAILLTHTRVKKNVLCTTLSRCDMLRHRQISRTCYIS